MNLHPDGFGSTSGDGSNNLNAGGITEGDRPAAQVPEMNFKLLFDTVHKILDDSIENGKDDLLERFASVLKNLIKIGELRYLKQFEDFKKTHQLRIEVLEALATGTARELKVVMNQLERTKAEKKRVEDVELGLRKENDVANLQISKLKQKLAFIWELVTDGYGSLQGLEMGSKSIEQEIMKTYSEESDELGAAQEYHKVHTENRKLYNELQDLKGNIRVYCRIRPFPKGQNQKKTTIEIIGEDGELVLRDPKKEKATAYRHFKFNKVFSPTATQEEVYCDAQPLIRSVLDGYNVCILAYGQTGSGKTYTMMGPNTSSPTDQGVNYKALNDLFSLSQSRRDYFKYEIGVQMVEIYNDQVFDLLSNDGVKKGLGIRNYTQPDGLAIPDASMHYVTSAPDVMKLMQVGLLNRTVGAMPTALNERSSRSHCVLTVHVRGTDLETDNVLQGKLQLVDLAGNERTDGFEAQDQRFQEAVCNNKSLSALADVIHALANKSRHVPYRNSKLTRVLESALGVQAKILVFVQLIPDLESYGKTLTTLKFAEKMSGVELGAARINKEGRGASPSSSSAIKSAYGGSAPSVT